MDADWIKERLKRPGKSQAGLARALAIDPSAITRLLKGDRLIKVHEVPAIRRYFDEPEGGDAGDVNLYRTMDAATPFRSIDTIPVLGTAEGGADGIVEWNGDVVDRVPCPPFLAGAKGAYAVYVVGDSMSPKYEAGEIIYVHPGRPVTAGSYVLVQVQEGEDVSRAAFVKQFMRRTSSSLTLRQFNPRKSLEIPNKKVVAVHRIVGSSES